jgi:hypothetical protein
MQRVKIDKQLKKTRLLILFITYGIGSLILAIPGETTVSLIQVCGTGPLVAFGGIILFFYPSLVEYPLFLLTLRGLQAACIILKVIDNPYFYPTEVGMLFALMLAYKQHYTVHLARIAVAVVTGICHPKKNQITYILLAILNIDAILEVIFNTTAIFKAEEQPSSPTSPQRSKMRSAERKEKSPRNVSKDKTYPRPILVNRKFNNQIEVNQPPPDITVLYEENSQRPNSESPDPPHVALSDSGRNKDRQSMELLPQLSTSRLPFNELTASRNATMMYSSKQEETQIDNVPKNIFTFEQKPRLLNPERDESPRRGGQQRCSSQNHFTVIDIRTDMRARVHNIIRRMSTNHKNTAINPADMEITSSQNRPFPTISKNIESEYLSMIDQVIIVSDQNLGVIYNNYHERLYDKILKPLKHIIDPHKIRSKCGFKLDRIFHDKNKCMKVDPRSLAMLGQMLDELDVELNSDTLGTYFKSPKTVHVAVSLLSILKKTRKKLENSGQSRSAPLTDNRDPAVTVGYTQVGFVITVGMSFFCSSILVFS